MYHFLYQKGVLSKGSGDRRNKGVKRMKIDSSVMGMASARKYQASAATIRRFAIADYRQGPQGSSNSLNGAAEQEEENTKSENTDTSEEETAETAVLSLQDWQSRLQPSHSSVIARNEAGQTYAAIRYSTISYIFNLLFSERRNRLTQWLQEKGIQTCDQTAGTLNIQLTASSGQGRNGGQRLSVLEYHQTVIQTETEHTAFSTTGTVHTADGRDISFNVNVGMSRSFQQYFEQNLELETFTMCDPLVINLDTEVTELSDQTFYFDLDADGEKDKIARLGSGSGYLALDINEDGIINDGSELFGTASGNGFADLARYDEDGNGWIDENDTVWNQLKIWCKDENGEDVLYRLAEKGVGAVCLRNVSTEFTVKGQDGRTKGAVRSTGIFLYENGSAGTVQHVDVAKYTAQA